MVAVRPDPIDKGGELIVFVEVGARGHLTAAHMERAAAGLLVVAQSNPCAIELLIGGYGDDPRPIWQIPVAAAFFRDVLHRVGVTHWMHPLVSRFTNATISALTLCGVFGTDHPFTVTIEGGSALDPELAQGRPGL